MLFLTTRKLTLITDEMLEYKTTQRYLYSSRDKEQDGIQFLQIGVTTYGQVMAKLNYCEFFMKCVFCTMLMLLLSLTPASKISPAVGRLPPSIDGGCFGKVCRVS